MQNGIKVPRVFVWSAEAEEELKRLFLAGLSHRTIATMMDGPTQGSISSKVKNMQAAGKLPRKSQRGNHQVFHYGKIDKSRPSVRVMQQVEKLERRSCRFPIGDLHDPDFRFCGKRRRDHNTSYCAEHHKVCWEVRLVRRRQTA